jgi:hypothetical protein
LDVCKLSSNYLLLVCMHNAAVQLVALVPITLALILLLIVGLEVLLVRLVAVLWLLDHLGNALVVVGLSVLVMKGGCVLLGL